MNNAVILAREIIALSQANDWQAAKLEWFVEHVYLLDKDDDPETCLCSHSPIKELCYLRNTLTDNQALVGNKCVNKFMNIDSEPVFSSLRAIVKDVNKGMSADLALYAYEHKFINSWEYDFCLDTRKRRKLSEKQQAKRCQINNLLIQHTRKPRKPMGLLDRYLSEPPRVHQPPGDAP